MTDAFTKYAELVSLKDKEATTVTKAIFEKWICRFSVPRQIVSDQGKEFVNSMTAELYRLLKIEGTHTSAMHPQTNSGAESFNRTIIRYMQTALDGTNTLDWELYLAPLALSYNTGIHKTTLQSPFFLTFAHEANLPYFDLDNPRPMYSESWATEAFQRLQQAYKLAHNHSQDAQKRMKYWYDRIARRTNFAVGDKVLVHFPRSTFSGNPKFHQTWQEPMTIVRQVHENTFLVRKQHGRTSLVHSNRMKPYFEIRLSDCHSPSHSQSSTEHVPQHE